MMPQFEVASYAHTLIRSYAHALISHLAFSFLVIRVGIIPAQDHTDKQLMMLDICCRKDKTGLLLLAVRGLLAMPGCWVVALYFPVMLFSHPAHRLSYSPSLCLLALNN
jgi:hypothetical protein